uniref:Thiolase N-terminal domain-containing protein n=1 Tax=Trichuris muris TaxID=70415 RepID=A0A5S6QXZ5_TRIMR
MALKQGIFIVAAKRTAFGTYGGMLKNTTPTQMGAAVAQAALQQSGISPNDVGTVIFGNAIHSNYDTPYLTRHLLLGIGIPNTVPGLIVNRLCGSGFQSVINVAQELINGDCDIGIAGGAENMTQAPYAVRNVRFGTKLGKTYEFEDTLWQTLTDFYIKTPMGITAETLGAKYNITREKCDEIALRSQTRWALANRAGYFKNEITPIKVAGKKGEVVFDTDEHPRETTAEMLAKLKPVFKKDGIVTAGNASGVNDGAAAVVLATEEAVNKHRLTPMARLLGWKVVGCDPNIMGIGPVGAIRGLLSRVNMKLSDINLVEVNEAFASQYAAVEKELQLDPAITNVNGGAIAIGHPLGASGSRITTHLVYEMKRRQVKYGIGSACIGGGQGVAILLENVS